MQRLPVSQLISSFHAISKFEHVATLAMREKRSYHFDSRTFTELMDHVKEFKMYCFEMGFAISSRLSDELIDELKLAEPGESSFRELNFSQVQRTHEKAQAIVNCLRHEAVVRVALTLDPDNVALYEGLHTALSSAAKTKFPDLVLEIEEAAKCAAFGRATASVFHSMRAMEIVVKAVRACLGITVPLEGQERNWGVMLGRVRDNMTGRANPWAEREYFKALYARLDAVKDGFRNGTMHVENVYSDDLAKTILRDTVALIDQVAGRMDQNGLPLA